VFIDKVEPGAIAVTLAPGDAHDLILGLEQLQFRAHERGDDERARALDAMICCLELAKEQAEAQDRDWRAAPAAD
jgi:hypothetical protein